MRGGRVRRNNDIRNRMFFLIIHELRKDNNYGK